MSIEIPSGPITQLEKDRLLDQQEAENIEEVRKLIEQNGGELYVRLKKLQDINSVKMKAIIAIPIKNV